MIAKRIRIIIRDLQWPGSQSALHHLNSGWTKGVVIIMGLKPPKSCTQGVVRDGAHKGTLECNDWTLVCISIDWIWYRIVCLNSLMWWLWMVGAFTPFVGVSGCCQFFNCFSTSSIVFMILVADVLSSFIRTSTSWLYICARGLQGLMDSRSLR